MLAEMSAEEMTHWEALYARIEPMPERRADLRAGIVASATLAPWTKKGHRPPQPKDLVPDYDAPRGKPRQSAEEQKAIWARAVHLFNRVKDRGKPKGK